MNAPLLNLGPTPPDTSPPEFGYVLYSNCQGKSPTTIDMTGGWAALCARLTTHTIRADKDGPAFSLVRLKPGTKRKNENVECLYGFVIDSDEGLSREEGLARLAGYTYRAWSTHSNTEEEPRFRAVMPFPIAVLPDDWPYLFAGAVATFGEDLIDKACKDPARLYYLPSCPPETREMAWVKDNVGELLDPAPLIALGRQILAHEKTPEKPATGVPADTLPPWLPPPTPDLNAELTAHAWQKPPLWVMLSAAPYIDPDQPYPQWFSMGGGIHDATDGSDAGLQLFDDISAGKYRGKPSAKYKGRAEIEKLWRRYDQERERRSTAGTYLYQARQGGWQPPANAAVPTASLPLLEHPVGDRTNGKLFANHCRDRFAYNSSTKRWMKNDGSVWDECHHGEEMAAAKAFADRLLDEVAALYKATPEDDPKRAAAKQWMKAAQRLQEKQELKDMLEMAQSEPGMTVTQNAFDQDPYLLNVRNGVVDLRTGTLLQSSPRMRMARRAEAAYHPEAQCPLFLKTLDEVFQHDQATIDAFQLFVGYSATGDVSEERMFFLHGHGANGKTVICNAIADVLGTYSMTAPSTMLEVLPSSAGPRPDLVRLAGARLAMASETSPGKQWDSQTIKQLSSNETYTARPMYGNPVEIQPTAKFWVRGNHKPDIRDSGHGLWRRIVLIPFDRQFDAHEQDHGLLDKLRTERDGICRWIVEGAMRWWKARQHGATGLIFSPKIVAAGNEYRHDCDLLGQWIDEKCELATGAETDIADLYRSFKFWCEDSGRHTPTKQWLGKQLSERKFTSRKSNGKVLWAGIKLRSSS